MGKNIKLVYLLLLVIPLILLCTGRGAIHGQDIDIAAPVGYVNDFANILDSATVSWLDAYISRIEADTTAEIAVVTVDNLQGWEIEDYAIRLFSQWGIGKRDKDNGVLLLASKEDRVLRIEVGYGLEGAITDLEAGNIIESIIVPWFRQDDYSQGIYNGVLAIGEKIYAEHGIVPEELPQGSVAPAASQAGGGIPYFYILCLPLFFFLIIIIFLSNLFRRRCPRCRRFFKLNIKEKIIEHATYYNSGRKTVQRWCSICSFRDEKEVRIPKKSRASSWTSGGSSSSGSSGGGFGGGSSGGGGASGRW